MALPRAVQRLIQVIGGYGFERLSRGRYFDEAGIGVCPLGIATWLLAGRAPMNEKERSKWSGEDWVEDVLGIPREALRPFAEEWDCGFGMVSVEGRPRLFRSALKAMVHELGKIEHRDRDEERTRAAFRTSWLATL